ncbi:MAG TPA: DUF4920 domain-containing protein [Kofleriaceae bacterium]|nr:DUF4920 domain-containing protein [Kofleriaceae bacterium]
MRIAMLVTLALFGACTKAASDKPAPAPATPATATSLGAPIAAGVPVVGLAAIAKDPAAYKGKSFITTGTVTAVCQEMGCWMEIKDDATDAHIKMAGEKFFVPKTSAGHKARVQGTLVEAAGGDVECNDKPAGKSQVAKLELEATGVELD